MFKTIIIFILFATAHLASAQPFQSLSGIPIDTSADKGVGSFVNLMFTLGVSFAALAALIMIVIGGLERMTKDSIQKQTDGSQRIRSAIFGLLIALSSYLLLETINPQLTNLNVDPSEVKVTLPTEGSANAPIPPTQLPPQQQPYVPYNPQIPGTPIPRPGQPTYSPADVHPSGGSPQMTDNEQQMRNRLSAMGYSVNKQPPATRVEGFRRTTLEAMAEMKNGCCPYGSLIITGGTEAGHASGKYSHGNGYKFDIGLGASAYGSNNSQFDSYIRTRLLPGVNVVANVGYPATLPSGKKVTLRYEGNHWDVLAHP